jgi:hypothetical protein
MAGVNGKKSSGLRVGVFTNRKRRNTNYIERRYSSLGMPSLSMAIVKSTGYPVKLAANRNEVVDVIRKLKSGKYRLYSRKVDPKTGKRKNLGTFDTREAAEKHERAVQYFKRKG